MRTDKQLYKIFEAEPEWVFQLTGIPSPGASTLRSLTVKALERKADGVIVPEACEPPLTVIEFQFQKNETIYTRTVAEMVAVQEANQMRPVQGLIFFGYNNLDPQTEPWTRVVRAFVLPELLNAFEREHPAHPLVAVFIPRRTSNGSWRPSNSGSASDPLRRPRTDASAGAGTRAVAGRGDPVVRWSRRTG